MDTSFAVFTPQEGAVLDQISLQAIASIPNMFLGALMDGMVPDEDNIILHGLDIAGDWAAGGPPGTNVPDPQSIGLRISPGRQSLRIKKGFGFLWRFMRKCVFRGLQRLVLLFTQRW